MSGRSWASDVPTRTEEDGYVEEGWRLIGVAAGIAGALVPLGKLNEGTDVSVFGVTLSAWLLGIALYVLAGAGAARGGTE